MSKKVENVQALRGIAILAVLLPHLKIYETRFGHGILGASPLFAVGNAGVDLFFLISGFVMVTVAGRFRGPDGAADFLYRRATRIYPLYWFYSLLVLPLFLRHPEMVNSSDAGAHLILRKSFLLLPQQASPLVAQGWTLIHELYFYLVFAILLQAPARMFVPALLGWAVAVTGGALLIHSPGPSLAIVFNPVTFEFILGCFVAVAIRRGINRRGPLFIALGTVGFVIAAAVQVSPHSAWSRVLWYGVPSGLLLYGAAAAEGRNELHMPAALVYAGDISYSLYLSHGLVLAALGRVWWRYLSAGAVSNLTACLVFASIAVFFAALSNRLIERPLQSVLRHNPFIARPKGLLPQMPRTLVPAD